jgi:hypothetical protein
MAGQHRDEKDEERHLGEKHGFFPVSRPKLR